MSAAILFAMLGCASSKSSSAVGASTSLTAIKVAPADPTIPKLGTQQFSATGTYSNNTTQSLTGQVTWTSSNTAVATINAAGVATGATSGSAMIQASLNGVSGSTALSVIAATLQSISVSPANPSIPSGASESFAATGAYSDSSTHNITSTVTWSSSNTSVARVSNTSPSNGLATGVGTGTATIQASLSGVNGSTSLTVTPTTTSNAFAGVLTQHNDNARTGQNLNETILTPSNVNAGTFGELFSQTVDAYIYAQPLYVPNLSIAGATHNVVFVATEGDTVFAFDADDNSGGNAGPLWQASLIDAAHGATPGETTGDVLDDLGCTDLVPQVGITSTPVIDPATQTMYVEAKSEQSNGNYIQRLHMLDITTGAEKSAGPVVITATLPGTSDGGSSITFDPLFELNRPGLLLANGTVYLAFASHCDDTPFHGWILAYSESSLAQTAVYLTTPNGEGAGGIWMSGAGLPADSNGDIFTATANGSYDATDVGDSILHLNGTTLSLLDYFTPFDQGNDDTYDLDVASGGTLLLPDQPGAHPHELVQGTKGGNIYVIDRDQMTTNNQHYCAGCTSDPEIVQELLNAGDPHWLFASPAYWNAMVYFWGAGDVLKAYTVDNGMLVGPTTSSTILAGFPGSTPSISANGTSNGILWVIDSSQFGSPGPGPGPALLHAYDATNLANELWNSGQTAGNAVKFAVPTIANGKVYIGTQTELDVYGLF